LFGHCARLEAAALAPLPRLQPKWP